jgi:signal transduction histidine kinase
MWGIYRRSLGIKIALWVSLALIVVFGLITFYNFTYQKFLIEKREAGSAGALAATILGAIRYPMFEGEQEAIQKQFELIKKEHPELVLHLLDDKGIIKRSTEPELIGERSEAKNLPIALRGVEVKGLEFRKRVGGRVYEELKPIMNEKRCYPCHGSSKRVLGVLRIAHDFRPAELAIINTRNRNILISLIGFFVAVFLIIFLSRGMLAPLSSVVGAFREITRKGDFSERIEVKTQDEVGVVAEAFNQMVNQLKTVQEQLIQSEKMAAVGRLASGIAHEIRNPLAIILQGTYLVEAELGQKNEEISKTIEMIKNSVRRANNIIHRLLEYARSSEMEVSPQNISKVIDEGISIVEKQATFKNIEIEKNYPQDAILVNADKTTLPQVFLNLTTNAIDAMPQGGKIKIRAYKEGDWCVIHFQDTGKGIPQSELPKIFEPFYTTKVPGEGTGLGLAMVQLIIERHRGRISVESQLGKGTKFIIKLPLAKA